jgi:phosphotriesterase-related protein
MAAAVEAVTAGKVRGCARSSIPTAMFGGRSVRVHARGAPSATGVRIVACTGIYTYDYLPHAFENPHADQIAEYFVEDIVRGCQGTDIKRRRFLKCAPTRPGDRAHRGRSTRACARGRRSRPGAPIMPTRCAVGTGPRQVDVFSRRRRAEEDPDRHCAHSRTSCTCRGSSTGASTSLDRYGSTCTAHGPAQRGDRGACCGAATPSASSSRRTSARRSTGSRPRSSSSSSSRRRSTTGR